MRLHDAVLFLPYLPNVNINMNDNDNNNENIAEFMAYSHINSRYIFSFYKYFFKKTKKKEEVVFWGATSSFFVLREEKHFSKQLFGWDGVTTQMNVVGDCFH